MLLERLHTFAPSDDLAALICGKVCDTSVPFALNCNWTCFRLASDYRALRPYWGPRKCARRQREIESLLRLC